MGAELDLTMAETGASSITALSWGREGDGSTTAPWGAAHPEWARLAALERRVERLEATCSALCEEIGQIPQVYSAHILDLGDPRYLLRCPLLVKVECYPDEVVATLPDLDLYASATSDALALARLKAEIVSTYERLVELGPRRLGPLPLRWLSMLESILERTDHNPAHA